MDFWALQRLPTSAGDGAEAAAAQPDIVQCGRPQGLYFLGHVLYAINNYNPIVTSYCRIMMWIYIYIYQINANDKAGQFQQMGAQAVDQFSWNIVQHSAEKILAKPRLQWVLWNGQRPWRFARWCTTAACHVKSQDHWTFLRFSTGTLHAS